MKREPWVLIFAMIFPTIMAWLYFVVASPPVGSGSEANPALQALYLAGKVVQFGLPAAWIALVDRPRLRIARPGTAGIGIAIVFGCAVAAAVWLVYTKLLLGSEVLADAPERIRSKLIDFGMSTPSRFWLLAIALSLVNSAMEEYYWRWFVFGRLKNWLPAVLAMVLAGFAFMGHHVIVLHVYFPGRFWSTVVPLSLGIAIGGIVWAAIYHASGSLAGPWLSHVIVDLAVMSVGYDLVFGH